MVVVRTVQYLYKYARYHVNSCFVLMSKSSESSVSQWVTSFDQLIAFGITVQLDVIFRNVSALSPAACLASLACWRKK